MPAVGEYAEAHAVEELRKQGIAVDDNHFDTESRQRLRPACPKCGKKLKAVSSIPQHMHDKHHIGATK